MSKLYTRFKRRCWQICLIMIWSREDRMVNKLYHELNWTVNKIHQDMYNELIKKRES